jgi:hypothetical protein
MNDQPGWQAFGSDIFARGFGLAVQSETPQVSVSHHDAAPHNSSVEQILDALTVRWQAKDVKRSGPLVDSFAVNRRLDGNYEFLWNARSRPIASDAAMQQLSEGLAISRKKAAMVATKATMLTFPDVLEDDWYVSANELAFTPLHPFFGRRRGAGGLIDGDDRLSRCVTLRKRPATGRYISAMIDVSTGDVLQLQLRTTPVE